MNEAVKMRLTNMEVLINNPGMNDAGHASQMMINIIKEEMGGVYDFALMETLLRKNNSRVFLLALPIEWFGNDYTSFIPGSQDKKSHALWVCMNGKKEAESTLNTHKISHDENAANLKSCGLLGLLKN